MAFLTIIMPLGLVPILTVLIGYQAEGLPHDLAALIEQAKANPKDSRLHFKIGNGYENLGRYPEAIVEYQKAISVDRDFPEALYNLGSVYVKTGKNLEAIAVLSHAIEVKKDFSEAYVIDSIDSRRTTVKFDSRHLHHLWVVQGATVLR